jgi:MFS family permease
MVVLMVMLAAGVIIERISAHCWQTAISTYYYTSAHNIVTAALLALGTLFVIYRGSTDTEDVLLTLAGVSALTAAMVPQARPSDLCPGPANLPLDFDNNAKAAMLPNVWALAIALGLGYLLIWSVMLVKFLHGHPPRPRKLWAILSLCLFWLIMLLGLIALVFYPEKFKEYAHGAAAVLLLSAFIATTFCTAIVVGREDPSKSAHQRGYKHIYWGIAWLMLATLIAVLWARLLHPTWFGAHGGFWAEWALIVEFAVYWVVQTVDLWKTPDRSGRFTEGPPPGL